MGDSYKTVTAYFDGKGNFSEGSFTPSKPQIVVGHKVEPPGGGHYEATVLKHGGQIKYEFATDSPPPYTVQTGVEYTFAPKGTAVGSTTITSIIDYDFDMESE